MDPYGALNILNQASAHFRGTREEHMMVQEAINVIQNLINAQTPAPVAAESIDAGAPAAAVGKKKK